MAFIFEYIFSWFWGNDTTAETLTEEELDSLDDSLTGITSMSQIGIGYESRLVIRKSVTGSSAQFKAVPSMVIKDPEPSDHYDARVIAIIFAPAGVFIGSLGSAMSLLAYTDIAGFPSEESVAVARYGYHVNLLGPILVGLGLACELVGFAVVLCTPHSRRFPMIYPKKDDDDEEELVEARPSRRVSVAPEGLQLAKSGSATADESGPKLITPGSQLAIVRASQTIV